ncbi:uncharacterized protein [Amphiura filiformis]|uniref:uncharacterized protein n=1 Tax=Amphiura filiformis TaxID=82378 RepID=UPI003B21303E
MAPNNGEIHVEDSPFMFGSVIRYSCHNGYTLEGPVTRTCQKTGKWTGDTPYCIIVQCPPLSFDGPWEDGGNFYGQVSTFRCNRGYIMKGSAVRTCQADSTWSGTEAVCKKKGGVDIYVTKGNGTLISGGELDPDTLIVNRNVGSITLACKFSSPVEYAYWTMNNLSLESIIAEHRVEETVKGVEWQLTMEIGDRNQGTYACRSADNAAEIIVDIMVDVFVDLTKGRGDISTERDPRNYHLKVLPGETITLSCTLGYYSTNYVVQWKREPSTLLYSSYTGPEILPRTDSSYGRLTFSPYLKIYGLENGV